MSQTSIAQFPQVTYTNRILQEKCVEILRMSLGGQSLLAINDILRGLTVIKPQALE